MRYVTEVLSNGDDLYIQFSEEILEKIGWKEGDIINWTDNKDGTFSLTKKETEAKKLETEFVIVDAISMFRMRYCVEVPKGKKEWAGDTVVCGDAKEFSQLHLDEVVTSMRTVSKEEAIQIFKEDNDYLSGWSDDVIVKNAFTLQEDLK